MAQSLDQQLGRNQSLGYNPNPGFAMPTADRGVSPLPPPQGSDWSPWSPPPQQQQQQQQYRDGGGRKEAEEERARRAQAQAQPQPQANNATLGHDPLNLKKEPLTRANVRANAGLPPQGNDLYDTFDPVQVQHAMWFLEVCFFLSLIYASLCEIFMLMIYSFACISDVLVLYVSGPCMCSIATTAARAVPASPSALARGLLGRVRSPPFL